MANIDLESLKQTKVPPSWPRGLFVFSLVFFIIVLGIYLALNYFWIAKEESTLNSLKSEFQKIRSEFPLEKENEVILFEKRLNLLKKLLNQHSYFSQALLKIEEITHPQVYYTGFSFSRDKYLLSLEGISKDQYTFSEAVNGFVNHPEVIKTVIVKQTKISPDKTIDFSVDVYLNPNIFKLSSF